jgi:hypothetical protein
MQNTSVANACLKRGCSKRLAFGRRVLGKPGDIKWERQQHGTWGWEGARASSRRAKGEAREGR